MLSRLQVRNYVLIDSLETDFPEGLIIITGQTGAGKSILMGALSLVMGAKAEASMVSEGADNCVVEAEFEIGEDDSEVRTLLQDNEVEWEDGHLIIRRVVNRSGRSRCFVNDSPVPVQVLQDISSRLVDIHSQHQTLLLSDKHFQLGTLDYFAGNSELREKCSSAWKELNVLKAELSQLDARISRIESEKDYNEAQFRQLEAAALKEGELEELEAEQKQLANAEEIKTGLCTAEELFTSASSSGEVLSLDAALKEAGKQLSRISRYVPSAGELSERVESCRRELDEYLGKPVRGYRLNDPEFQECECRLTGSAPLFENIDLSESVRSPEPLTFEELEHPFGFVLYRAELPALFEREIPITIKNVRDRAMVFVDGEFKGTFTRDREAPVIKCRADVPHRLDILVENLGRVNSRPGFGEEKGIGDVNYGVARVNGFTCCPIRLDDLGRLNFREDIKSVCPGFLRGRFKAKPGVPTHLDMRGFGKGVAFVNGFNLGRYWEIGPQQTLYVPGGLLKEENELVIFELEHAKSGVKFIKTAVMDEFHPEYL